MSRLRARWVTQRGPVGWVVMLFCVDAAGAVLNHHQDVKLAQEDGVNVREVDRGSRGPAW
jgi:hypothetical protein